MRSENAPLTQSEAEVLKRVGTRMREARSISGLSQNAVRARMLNPSGVKPSESYVGRMESGNLNFGLFMLDQYARAVGVTMADLVREDRSPSESEDRILRSLAALKASELGLPLDKLLMVVAKLSEDSLTLDQIATIAKIAEGAKSAQ